jgi:hypothetical protein
VNQALVEGICFQGSGRGTNRAPHRGSLDNHKKLRKDEMGYRKIRVTKSVESRLDKAVLISYRLIPNQGDSNNGSNSNQFLLYSSI